MCECVRKWAYVLINSLRLSIIIKASSKEVGTSWGGPVAGEITGVVGRVPGGDGEIKDDLGVSRRAGESSFYIS